MIYLIKDNKTKAQFEVTEYWYHAQSAKKGNEGRYEILKELDKDVRETYVEKRNTRTQSVTPKPTITPAKAVEVEKPIETVTVSPEPTVSITAESNDSVGRNTRNSRN